MEPLRSARGFFFSKTRGAIASNERGASATKGGAQKSVWGDDIIPPGFYCCNPPRARALEVPTRRTTAGRTVARRRGRGI